MIEGEVIQFTVADVIRGCQKVVAEDFQGFYTQDAENIKAPINFAEPDRSRRPYPHDRRSRWGYGFYNCALLRDA